MNLGLIGSLVEGVSNISSNLINVNALKKENAITREREDTAFSRAATDMENAGLSKTLAAGSPSEAKSLNAPQVEFSALDAFNSFVNSKKAESDILLDNAQIDLANANAEKARAEAEDIKVKTDLNTLDYDYYSKFNLSPAQNNKFVQAVNSIVSEVVGVIKGSRGNDNGFYGWLFGDSVDGSKSATPSPDSSFVADAPFSDASKSVHWSSESLDRDGRKLWDACGTAFMDYWLGLPNSFTDNLRYNSETHELYLEGSKSFDSVASSYLNGFRDSLAVQTGLPQSDIEIAMKCMIVYGLKERLI